MTPEQLIDCWDTHLSEQFESFAYYWPGPKSPRLHNWRLRLSKFCARHNFDETQALAYVGNLIDQIYGERA